VDKAWILDTWIQPDTASEEPGPVGPESQQGFVFKRSHNTGHKINL